MHPDNLVIRSTHKGPPYESPNVSLPEYMFSRLRAGVSHWKDKPLLVDVTAKTSVKFCELEDQSRRVASALSRRGFKKGDVLYFVTYEMAQLYVVQVAVWRLGGAVRGCYQAEAIAEYVRQLNQTRSRFVLVDADTAPLLREACSTLDWSVEMLSVGNVVVTDATSFQDLLKDDGSALPTNVDINPEIDVVTIPNTSGSTGVPKGVMHTHSTSIAYLKTVKDIMPNTSMLECMITYGVGTFAFSIHATCSGLTVYHVGRYEKDKYFDILLEHKPRNILMYPYIASWFARCSEQLARIREASFLESLWIGGWVLDHTTADLVATELPSTDLRQLYGMTEILFLTITDKAEVEQQELLTSVENQGQLSVSVGKLMPYTEAKVVDVTTGEVMPAMGIGELHVRTPCLMRGYLVPGGEPNRSDIDGEGWFRTGDMAFYDQDGNFYIKERLSFMFKYFMNYVSPSDIENVLQEHPAVQGVGVVGVPNPESDSLARGFVVLRSGCHATSDELQRFVAERLPKFKHLHGGVRFVQNLPINRGGKMDRNALKKMAIEDKEMLK